MKKTVIIAVVASAFALTACNKSPSDNLADRVDNAADARADVMENNADAMRDQAAMLDNRADATRDTGESPCRCDQGRRQQCRGDEPAAARRDRRQRRSGGSLNTLFNQRRMDMGEFTDKMKAAGNKVAGKVKEEIGDMTDNQKLEAEGKAQQVKGSAQDVKGSVKGALGDDI